ncbi:MAG TPA: hypothetical protein VH661_01220 [Candidatus Dormibacteraeota bacterium]|nr:hypothetical protein [Candidatus Dormibacteraeota bacterium]
MVVGIVVAAVAALLVVGAAIGGGQVKKGTATALTPAATRSAAATATPAPGFTDPTNHFSASFRDAPVEDSNSLSVAGHPVSEVLWSDAIDVSTAEIVGYATYPASFNFSAPNAALNGAVAGEVSNVHGTLLSKTFGVYQGFHSVDAVISAQQVFIESRAILAGQTVYIVITTSAHNPPELFAGFAPTLTILTHS